MDNAENHLLAGCDYARDICNHVMAIHCRFCRQGFSWEAKHTGNARLYEGEDGDIKINQIVMKNRNLDHKNDWRTPRSLIEKLEAEFWKMFDPCPFMHDMSWDGLKIEWGGLRLSIHPILSKRKKSLWKKPLRRARSEKLASCFFLSPQVPNFFTSIFFQTKKRFVF